jgi:hypothetical protein
MIVPIFSGGVGRSGTTLIGHLFKNHKDIFVGMPYEVKFITNVFGLVDFSFGIRNFPKTQITKYGQVVTKLSKFDSTHTRFIKFKKTILGEWWETSKYNPGGGLGITMSKSTMEKILDEFESNLNDPVEAARNFTCNYIINHKEYNGQKYWIDTSPTNIMYSDLIYKIFPEAKFIEMRRNPLDNIGAVIKQNWGPNNEDFGIKWWSDRIKIADSAIKKIPQERHILLTLEDFVRDNREENYNKLCSFVEVSNDQPKVIEYFNNNITIEDAHIGRWINDFKNPIEFKNKFDNFIKQDNYNYRLDLTL